MNELDKISSNVNEELNNIDKSPFSDQGFIEFKNQIEKFISHLFGQSLLSCKRNNVDTISAKHVQDAANYLSNTNSFKLGDFFNLIGGIFLGSTLNFIINLFSAENQYSIISYTTYLLLGIIGASLIVYTLAKKQ